MKTNLLSLALALSLISLPSFAQESEATATDDDAAVWNGWSDSSSTDYDCAGTDAKGAKVSLSFGYSYQYGSCSDAEPSRLVSSKVIFKREVHTHTINQVIGFSVGGLDRAKESNDAIIEKTKAEMKAANLAGCRTILLAAGPAKSVKLPPVPGAEKDEDQDRLDRFTSQSAFRQKLALITVCHYPSAKETFRVFRDKLRVSCKGSYSQSEAQYWDNGCN